MKAPIFPSHILHLLHPSHICYLMWTCHVEGLSVVWDIRDGDRHQMKSCVSTGTKAHCRVYVCLVVKASIKKRRTNHGSFWAVSSDFQKHLEYESIQISSPQL